MPTNKDTYRRRHLRLVIDNTGSARRFQRPQIGPELLPSDLPGDRILNLRRILRRHLSGLVEPVPDVSLFCADCAGQGGLTPHDFYGPFEGDGSLWSAHGDNITSKFVMQSTGKFVGRDYNKFCSLPAVGKLAKIVADARIKRGWSQSDLARRVGVKPQSIQQLEADGVARPRYIHELSEALGLDLRTYLKTGQLVTIHNTPVAPNVEPPSNVEPAGPLPSGRRDLPVYASAEGGPDGMIVSYDPIEWVERPEPLFGVPGAFAMFVVNDSMEPKYGQGDLLLIHPSRPVHKGDSVLCIKTSDDTEHSALIKELVSLDADKVVLKQHNPSKTFKIARSQIKGLHKVIGAYWGS